MGKIFEKIYSEVKKIPKGQTATYGEIARKAGTSPRVVGFALHANPDPENVPCHRVIFKDGSLSPGYVFGGEGKQRKKLEAEGVRFESHLGSQTGREGNKESFCPVTSFFFAGSNFPFPKSLNLSTFEPFVAETASERILKVLE